MNCRNNPGNSSLACAPEDVRDGTLALQPMSVPAPVCHESSWRVVRAYDKTGYVMTAWKYAFRDYANDAIILHTSQDFLEIVQGLLPFLQQALLLVGASTVAGAGVGAAGGSLVFGIGALPGAGFGAEVGLEAAIIILDILGVGYLLVFITDHLVEMSVPLTKGIKAALDSCGSEGELREAGRMLADGFGIFCSLLLQAAAAYILHEGFKAGSEKLGNSKLGARFANYATRVAQRDYCLKELGLTNEPAFVKNNIQTVVNFVNRQNPAIPLDDIVKTLHGIDINKPVGVIQLLPGETLVQYYQNSLGRWFARVGTPKERLGIAAGNRRFTLWKVNSQIDALESTAASTADNWTQLAATGVEKKFLVGGGSKQYLIGDPRASMEYVIYDPKPTP